MLHTTPGLFCTLQKASTPCSSANRERPEKAEGVIRKCWLSVLELELYKVQLLKYRKNKFCFSPQDLKDSIKFTVSFRNL